MRILIVSYECMLLFDIMPGLAFYQHLQPEEVKGDSLMTWDVRISIIINNLYCFC